MEIDEVLQKIEKDVVFYGFSSGGVTFSGGEPLMHWQFAAELASELQSRLIDTAIETTGYAKWESAWEVFQHCDRILYDIKVLDSRTHRKLTGVDNALILENAARLAETNKEVIYRIPLIKDINDSIEHTSAFIALAKQNHVLEINLLPYHEYGKPKYDALGKEYSFKGCAPSDEHVKELTNRIENSGLTVSVGG